ncbi:hypothetical protein ACFL1S_04050 [Pseudomonadota bacterium]
MGQIAAMFGQFGLAAEMYWDETISAVLGRSADRGWADIHPLKDDATGEILSKQYQDKDCLVSLLHYYIESGMSPIIGLPGHVVVALGVAYDDNKQVFRDGNIVLNTDFLSGIVVNDDNCEPYRLAQRHQNDKEGDDLYHCDSIDSMVVPMPEKVFLVAEKAEITATALANELGPPTTSDDQFLRRLYCTSSRNYKEFRRASSDQFLTKLVELPLPHFIWVTEFTSLPDKDSESDDGVLVEIAVDATAGQFDDHPYVWIRYPQFMIINWQRIYGETAAKQPFGYYYVDASLTLRQFTGNLRCFS